MSKSKKSKRHAVKRCRHCKAPGKSVFEDTPLLTKYELKHYTLETDQYNILHFFDQQKKDLPREWKPKTVTKDCLKTISMFSRISDNPLNQKWSGYTFMTENENERIERNYQERLAGAKVDRIVWRKFQKKLKVERIQARMNNAGPLWFQDLSPQQTDLIDRFEAELEADMNERHSGRSQNFLYGLGICPVLPPQLVARCVKTSGANVINFIFLVHKEVVDRETPEYEKKFTEAKRMKMPISPYSINERLLLTSVFHYHFPKLLKKLDELLPPPYQEPKILWAKKPPKKKKVYASPYLEPLPISDKPWYEERAEKELQKKVLRKVMMQKNAKKKQQLTDKMAEEETRIKQKRMVKKPTPPTEERPSLQPRSMSIFNEDDVVNMAALPPRERKSFFFQKYSTRLSSYVECRLSENEEIEAEEQSYTTESPHSPSSPDGKKKELGGTPEAEDQLIKETQSSEGLFIPNTLAFSSEELETVTSSEDLDIHPAPPVVDSKISYNFKATLQSGLFGSYSHNTRCLLDTEMEHISEDIHLIKAPSVNTPKTSSEESVEEFKPKNFWVPLDITFKELTSVSRISSRSQVDKEPLYPVPKMSGPPFPDLSALKSVIRASKMGEATTPETPVTKKPYVVECSDSTCALVEGTEIPMSEFELAKKRISTMTGKKQLSAAIRFLCDKGDPLAILPDMEMVPWLTRWHDKRRGIKRHLTKQDREELIQKSLDFWSAPYTRPTAVPMMKVPEKIYTWNEKKWFMNRINTRLHNHHRAIKQVLIDNARDLFPTMFCEYYDTPLNKRFKNTFFAYFPAKERDCLVSKPWNPNSDKGLENNQTEH